jgi:hypothetical protein
MTSFFPGWFNPISQRQPGFSIGVLAVWESAVGLVVVADSESGSDRFLLLRRYPELTAGVPGLRSRNGCEGGVGKARRTLRSLGEGG